MEMPGATIQTSKVAAEVTRRTSQPGISAPPRLCVEIGFPASRTKSDHFREREFSTPVKSTTCNFNTLKCPNLKVGTPRRDVRIRPGTSLGFGTWGLGFLLALGAFWDLHLPPQRFS